MRARFFGFLALALACGGEEGGSGSLDPSVESVPDGDAMGSDRSGDYDVELYTTSCSGQCTVEYPVIGTVSYCDVGDSDSEGAEVTQTDGHLRIDLNDTPSRYEGGIDCRRKLRRRRARHGGGGSAEDRRASRWNHRRVGRRGRAGQGPGLRDRRRSVVELYPRHGSHGRAELKHISRTPHAAMYGTATRSRGCQILQ